MKNFFISFILAFLLIGCSEKKEPILLTDTIVSFGDSLTFGYGAQENESYPYKLKEIIGYNVINEGINGDTAQNGVKRIVEVVQEHQPKLVLLSLGGNDMLRQSSQNLESNLKNIIQFLKSKNIEVVLIAEPQPSMMGQTFGLSDAKVYEKVAKDENILLIENVFSKYLSKEELKSDLIHLNAKGYEKVAQDVAKKLKDSGYIVF